MLKRAGVPVALLFAAAFLGCGPSGEKIAEIEINAEAPFGAKAAGATVHYQVKLVQMSDCDTLMSGAVPSDCVPTPSPIAPSSHKGDVEAGPVGSLIDLTADDTQEAWLGTQTGYGSDFEVLFREGWGTDTQITTTAPFFPNVSVAKTTIAVGEPLDVIFASNEVSNISMSVVQSGTDLPHVMTLPNTVVSNTTLQIPASTFSAPGKFDVLVHIDASTAATVTPSTAMTANARFTVLLTQQVTVL